MSGTEHEMTPQLAPRFFDSHVGKTILNEPIVALVELVANAWDAGATEVSIVWPRPETTEPIRISDNGTGMTKAQFERRFMTLAYDRLEDQGTMVRFPPGTEVKKRHPYGRNGVGRWAAFCFGNKFMVRSTCEGLRNTFEIERPEWKTWRAMCTEDRVPAEGHGTVIAIEKPRRFYLTEEAIRSELGTRFLVDPDFKISVNQREVSFSDISHALGSEQIITAGGHEITLVKIEASVSDRSSNQHGIAWHVNGRLVGTCSWEVRGQLSKDFDFDQRKAAAKRLSFVVRADYLADLEVIGKDWTTFDVDSAAFIDAARPVYTRINEHIFEAGESKRERTKSRAAIAHEETLQNLSPLSREKWDEFVDEVQVRCPSLSDSEVVKLAGVMANLEASRSQYGLLHRLASLGPDQLDDLDKILADWTIGMAKTVLDEIAARLLMIQELEQCLASKSTREVQDMQPLFKGGLWIFGPQFESVEFTSNQAMTTVVQALFPGGNGSASDNRPDFVILPDGTAGLYACPHFDEEDGEENGIAELVIVELKKPTVSIGSDEKGQCWKYVKELYALQHLSPGRTKVRCFVVGCKAKQFEDEVREEMGGLVKVQPMLYSNVIARAKSRMLKLHERVKCAPFLREMSAPMPPRNELDEK